MNKLMIKIFLTILLFLFSLAYGICQKSEFKKSPISGIWIETTNKSDSLIFLPEYDGQNPMFELNRGFDGYNRSKHPKQYSGTYWYILEGNSISIKWLFSSDSRFQTYYFWQSDDKTKLRISDFFGCSIPQKDTLTFLKIK